MKLRNFSKEGRGVLVFNSIPSNSSLHSIWGEEKRERKVSWKSLASILRKTLNLFHHDHSSIALL